MFGEKCTIFNTLRTLVLQLYSTVHWDGGSTRFISHIILFVWSLLFCPSVESLIILSFFSVFARYHWCGYKQWKFVERWILHWTQAKKSYRTGSQIWYLIMLTLPWIYRRCNISLMFFVWSSFPFSGIFRTFRWIYVCRQAELWGESAHSGRYFLAKLQISTLKHYTW